MNKNELSPKEKRDKITKLILSKKYGETLNYDELNLILQEDLDDYYGKQHFIKQMNKVKNELFSKGYVIRPIYNVGYYILKPEQISSYTYRTYITKPLKSFKKAETILMNTEKANLKGKYWEEYKATCNLNNAIIDTNTKLINSKEYEILKDN